MWSLTRNLDHRLRLLSRSWAALGLSAAALLIAEPAHACQYSQVPEPVGHASAEFFTKRMAPDATFVDVAVAEETRPAFGGARPPAPTVYSTTFRVVYRLKGQSPDRFSLYVHQLKSGDPIPEPKHFVDEQGRVSPYPYPHEADPKSPFISSSCDPGFLGVKAGQAYVVFREADGRLLGAVPTHEGRSERAFPLMPVTLDESFGWLYSAVIATAGQKPDTPARQSSSNFMAVRFRSGLSASEAERWARAAAVRPVTVSIARGKLIEESRVPLDQADIALIPYAMQASAANRGRYLRALAAQFLDETDERLELDLALQQEADLLFQSAAAEPDGAAPARVIAIEVTGTPQALAKLARNPQVAGVAAGFEVRGRTGADPLVGRAAPVRPWTGSDRRETGPSLRARLRALADGRPLPEPVLVPPTPPVDPFSFTGCIRIGEADALALGHPLFTQFGSFRLYAPSTTDCTRTATALTCRLPAQSAVRLDAGTRVGGFRVGPRPAVFELKEGTISCRREGAQ